MLRDVVFQCNLYGSHRVSIFGKGSSHYCSYEVKEPGAPEEERGGWHDIPEGGADIVDEYDI